MGTFAEEILRIQNAKSDLKTSLESKGISVPAELKLNGYSAIIDAMALGYTARDVTMLINRFLEGFEILDTQTVIGAYAFYGCGLLTMSKLPDALTEIKSNAFANCISLNITNIPSGVTKILTRGFYACKSLKDITFDGKPESIAEDAFEECTNIATITCPWYEGEIAGAPWGAVNAEVIYLAGTPVYHTVTVEYDLSIKGIGSFGASGDAVWENSNYKIIDGGLLNITMNASDPQYPLISKWEFYVDNALMDITPYKTIVNQYSDPDTGKVYELYRRIAFEGIPIYGDVRVVMYGESVPTGADRNAYTVDAVEGASYGFTVDNGWYVNNNKGIDGSVALARINLNRATAATVRVTCISYAEPYYDYGMLSVLDTALSANGIDSGTDIYRSFKNDHSLSEIMVDYSVEAGTHFIDAKYIKDSSGAVNQDKFAFKVEIL